MSTYSTARRYVQARAVFQKFDTMMVNTAEDPVLLLEHTQ